MRARRRRIAQAATPIGRSRWRNASRTNSEKRRSGLRFMLCAQALPQGVRSDGVIPMVRVPLSNCVDRPVASIKMLMRKGKLPIYSLAQVDDGDEGMCTLVRACRPVEDVDKLDWLH